MMHAGGEATARAHLEPCMSVPTGDVMAIFSPSPPLMLRNCFSCSSLTTGEVMAIFSLPPAPLPRLLPKM